MYLGIDFLISSEPKPYVIEVNVGLPGGAQEYHLTHLVHFGRPSDIFNRIEETSHQVYGRPFRDYLSSSSHIQSLKPFKIWMDEEGPFPKDFHPGLRLEDKWVQYQLLHVMVPMPETRAWHPKYVSEAEGLFQERKRWVFKRRLGRGGRGFRIIEDLSTLSGVAMEGPPSILQEFIESAVEGWTFSIRSIAFGGQFMCMYANLANRSHSNHGYLTFISEGDVLGLSERAFKTQSFNQKSWEAKIWFGETEPRYLRHNLYEDVVAQTTLQIPASVLDVIRETSIKIERFYEALDLFSLPKACFEE
jgi:hypothetical protein